MTWVTSSLKDITVENYNEADALQGDVPWSIVGNPQSAARNSVLTIEAGPVAGADYFAVFITNHGNWVTESHWMRANETGTTLLSGLSSRVHSFRLAGFLWESIGIR